MTTLKQFQEDNFCISKMYVYALIFVLSIVFVIAIIFIVGFDVGKQTGYTLGYDNKELNGTYLIMPITNESAKLIINKNYRQDGVVLIECGEGLALKINKTGLYCIK